MDESTTSNAEPGGDASANLSPTLQRIQVYSNWLDAILIRTGYISGGLFALTAFFITYDVLARKWGMRSASPRRASPTKSVGIF